MLSYVYVYDRLRMYDTYACYDCMFYVGNVCMIRMYLMFVCMLSMRAMFLYLRILNMYFCICVYVRALCMICRFAYTYA